MPYIARSAGGNKFTGAEIDLLVEEANHIMNLDEDQIINAWEAWASRVSISSVCLLKLLY